MPRSRFSTAIYLMLVFASGILVGVVSYRLYAATTVTATANAPRTMEQYRKQFIAEMRQKVGTNDAQISQINQALDNAKHRLDALHTQEKPLRDKIEQERIEEIRAALDDKQKVVYDNWRAERARMHAAEELKKQQQKKAAGQ